MLAVQKRYLRVVDFRLFNEVHRFVTPATDRVSEALCSRLSGRQCHAIRRESAALSNLIDKAGEAFATTHMVKSKEHD